jgi:hypothetical protein
LFVSLLVGGNVLNATVSYTGNGGQSFKRSDLDFNNVINLADWSIFVANAYGDLSGLSRAQAYALGDLDADGDNDHADFKLFKQDFNAVNGAGAFEAMLEGVPEPSAALLAAFSMAAALASRRAARVRPAATNQHFSMQEDD